MSTKTTTRPEGAAAILGKADPAGPALVVGGREAIAIRAGTVFAGRTFAEETPVPPPDVGYVPGGDYAVIVAGSTVGTVKLAAPPSGDDWLGGFHFAPGGNAAGRSGGDDVPAINPHSVYDRSFRPACPDPRGMVLVQPFGRYFWCDIYLLGADHLEAGTSRLGVTIADGADPPQRPGGGRYDKLDYETAMAVMAHHGKGLLGVGEFFAAAFGVTERTTCGSDPKVTRCDPARTSRWGLMQAAGNLWTWGHDEDLDLPRASIFGGSWWNDDDAGSRHAYVADAWPGDSLGYLGARGRCDRLQPG